MRGSSLPVYGLLKQKFCKSVKLHIFSKEIFEVILGLNMLQIQCYTNLPVNKDKAAMKAMLDSLVVIKLNGGLGTSMGCRYQQENLFYGQHGF
jgi:hypothetical protein